MFVGSISPSRNLETAQPGRYVFISERGAPMSAVAFRRMVTRLGPAAKMPFPIHPHMLRHSTGFKLANQGVDTWSLQHYLGATNIAPPRKAVMIDAKSRLALVLPCEILRGRHSQGMSASRWVARSE